MVRNQDIDAKYILVIHTNKYSGNFEREMSGYVAGVWDGETHGGLEARVFNEETNDEFQLLIDRAKPVPGESRYRFTPVSIWPTPGRLNEGGRHRDAEPDERGHPAYESVAIFFGSKPTDDELELIWRRAKQFEQLAAKRNVRWHTPGLVVRSMELIERARQVIISDTSLQTWS